MAIAKRSASSTPAASKRAPAPVAPLVESALDGLSYHALLAIVARAALRIAPTLHLEVSVPNRVAQEKVEAIAFCGWLAGLTAFVGRRVWEPSFDVALTRALDLTQLEGTGAPELASGLAAAAAARLARKIAPFEQRAEAIAPGFEDGVFPALQDATRLSNGALAAAAQLAVQNDIDVVKSAEIDGLRRAPLWPTGEPSGWDAVWSAWTEMLEMLSRGEVAQRHAELSQPGFDWQIAYRWVLESIETLLQEPEAQAPAKNPPPPNAARKAAKRRRTAEPAASLLPDDAVLFERDGTRLGFIAHADAWKRGFDAIVLPVGPGGTLGGQFATTFFKFAGEAVEQQVVAALEQATVTPATPLRVDLAGTPSRPALPRAVIVTTVSDPGVSAQHAARAAVGAVRCAADAGLASVVMPLLGTGAGKLDETQVLQRSLREIAAAPSFSPVRDVVLVSRNPRLTSVAVDLAKQLQWLTATPERASYDNDGPAKDDSLNVKEQARTFAKLLVARDTSMPLSLGLFGHWGAGKSYFMNLMQDAIDELTAKQPVADNTSIYLRRVAQIDFNAWNYIDSNLWASLAIRLFDGLAREYAPNETASAVEAVRRQLQKDVQSSERARQEAEKRQESAKLQRQEASVQLASLEARRLAAARDYGVAFWSRFLATATNKERLDRIRKAAGRLGLSDAVETGEDLNRLYRQVRQLQGRWQGLLSAIGYRFSNVWVALAAIGLMTGVVVGVTWLTQNWSAGIAWWQRTVAWLGRGVALVAPVLIWAGKQLNNVAKVTTELESLQTDFAATDPAKDATPQELALRQKVNELEADVRTQQEKISEAERRITAAQEELQRINAGGLVYDFATGRRAAAEYTSKLGIVSVIREDFNRLKDLLDDWHKNHQGAAAPIERIILYIDDLDRCHPDQVVEVLQAVHLLLAFDLFAVIVAVDPRWLERSLYKAYAAIDQRATDGTAGRGTEFSPQNYLEKIFQIPFSLPAMQARGYQKLIEAVIESRSEAAPSVPTPPPPQPPPPPNVAPANAPAATPVPVVATAQQQVVAATGPSAVPSPTPAAPVTPPPATPAASRDRSPVLEDWEKGFLQALHPFVDTPRLAKRLVNIYRLLRVRSTTLDGSSFSDFIDRERGDYRAVQVLLAINIGHPEIASQLFRRITTWKGASWRKFVEDLVADCRQAKGNGFPGRSGDRDHVNDMCDALTATRAALRRLEPPLAFPDDMAAFRRWAPEVGRYLFHWNVA